MAWNPETCCFRKELIMERSEFIKRWMLAENAKETFYPKHWQDAIKEASKAYDEISAFIEMGNFDYD